MSHGPASSCERPSQSSPTGSQYSGTPAGNHSRRFSMRRSSGLAPPCCPPTCRGRRAPGGVPQPSRPSPSAFRYTGQGKGAAEAPVIAHRWGFACVLSSGWQGSDVRLPHCCRRSSVLRERLARPVEKPLSYSSRVAGDVRNCACQRVNSASSIRHWVMRRMVRRYSAAADGNAAAQAVDAPSTLPTNRAVVNSWAQAPLDRKASRQAAHLLCFCTCMASDHFCVVISRRAQPQLDQDRKLDDVIDCAALMDCGFGPAPVMVILQTPGHPAVTALHAF